MIPVVQTEQATRATGGPQRVAVWGARGPSGVAERLEIGLSEYPELAPTAAERYLEPSFVLDFDEPAVSALRAELVRANGSTPSIEALRDFVARAIPSKTLERGWDLASQVAASGVGDCTEHAVLLAALARSLGRPARVVVGIVLVEIEGRHHAFGHAWSEILLDARWRVVDATPTRALGSLHYLPLALLRDEGPGFALALARDMQGRWARRIELIGPDE